MQRPLCMKGVQIGRTNHKSIFYPHVKKGNDNVVRWDVCAISHARASYVRYCALGNTAQACAYPREGVVLNNRLSLKLTLYFFINFCRFTPYNKVSVVRGVYERKLDSLPTLIGKISLRTHTHTTYTQRTLGSTQTNSLLRTHPAPIDPALEQRLACEDRVHLPRLHCGRHTSLPTYRHCRGLAPYATCAFCQNIEGTVENVLYTVLH